MVEATASPSSLGAPGSYQIYLVSKSTVPGDLHSMDAQEESHTRSQQRIYDDTQTVQVMKSRMYEQQDRLLHRRHLGSAVLDFVLSTKSTGRDGLDSDLLMSPMPNPLCNPPETDRPFIGADWPDPSLTPSETERTDKLDVDAERELDDSQRGSPEGPTDLLKELTLWFSDELREWDGEIVTAASSSVLA